MKHLYPVIILALLAAYCATSHGQDSILFKTGKRINCAVQGYTNGAFEVRLENGETKQAPAANISSISFGKHHSAAEASPTPVIEIKTAEEVAPAVLQKVKVDIGSAPPEEGQMLNKGIQLTVKKYDNMVSLDSDSARFIRKEGLKAVAVNVLVENKSAVPIEMDYSDFKIKDQDDNIYETWISGTGPRPWLDTTTIAPGDKMAAWIGFKASPGIVMEKSMVRYDNILKLMYSDWFPIGK